MPKRSKEGKAPAPAVRAPVAREESHKKKSKVEKKKPQGDKGLVTAAVPKAPTPTTAQPCERALLTVGTHHATVCGFVFNGVQGTLKPRFTTSLHVGSVNSVTMCDRYLVTVGSDEKIFVYMIKNHGDTVTELGNVNAVAEITHATFPNPRYLVCSTIEGQTLLYKTRTWEQHTTIETHTKRGVSVQSLKSANGNLCVSLGGDRYVVYLDMTSGKQISRIKIPAGSQPNTLALSDSSDGTPDLFAVAATFNVYVYDILTSKQICDICIGKQPKDQVHCAEFVKTGFDAGEGMPTTVVLAAGYEDARMVLWGINTADNGVSQLRVLQKGDGLSPHTCRIKSLTPLLGSASFVSADSAGHIAVWHVGYEEDGAEGTPGDSAYPIVLAASGDFSVRVTSLAAMPTAMLH